MLLKVGLLQLLKNILHVDQHGVVVSWRKSIRTNVPKIQCNFKHNVEPYILKILISSGGRYFVHLIEEVLLGIQLEPHGFVVPGGRRASKR